MHRPGRTFLGLVVGVVAFLAAVPAARAQLKLEWGTEGYYRTRAVSLTNLAPEPRFVVEHPLLDVPIVMPDIRSTSYITQRLRLQPTLKLENIAKLTIEITALDDILYGDNNALNTAPLFSVNGTNQYFLGGNEIDTVAVTRAWAEFQVPVGVMRIGRMPSHWGMGLLANGGGSGTWDPTSPKGEPKRRVADYYFDDDFGDNHFGSTNDRILFATKPLSIVKTVQKKPDTSSNFVLAYAFDKLAEAPYLLAEEDRLFRPFGQQGFISRGSNDDVNEHVLVAAYSDPDWDKVRYSDELKFGTYWVFRTAEQGFTNPSAGAPHVINGAGNCVTKANETNPNAPVIPDDDCTTKDEGSFVWIADVWYRIRYGSIYSEGEFVHIGGETTGGVPFPSANRRKKASINSGAIRVGYMDDKLDGILEVGYASGDAQLDDGTLQQRPMHPDYNVGLILFEETLRERSARAFGPSLISPTSPDGARGFMTNGGVVNSIYVAPKVRYRPGFAGVEVVGQVLVAFVDKFGVPGDNGVVSPNVLVCPNRDIEFDDDGNATCSTSKLLGTEFDLALKSRFAQDLIDFSLEGGYLLFGDVLKTTSTTGQKIDGAPSGSFTIQARVAFVW